MDRYYGPSAMRLNDPRWIAYWYLCIALGFLLLAVYNAMIGGKLWLVGVRLIIAGGFGFLGWMELQTSAGKKTRRKK
jgi:hypothetical protein